MRTTDIRARILLSLGASLATAAFSSCGSTTTDHGADAASDVFDKGDGATGESSVGDGNAVGDSGTSFDTSGDAPGASGSSSPRRPFLVGSSLRKAGTEGRADWRRAQHEAGVTPAMQHGEAGDALIDEKTRKLLALSWGVDAAEEHASIAAFARFTMLLLSVGAPPDLVIDSQRAGIDEIHHARACFSLASRYTGRNIGPSPLVVHDTLGHFSLADLAALTAEEACVGETLGLVLAGEQLAEATDPEVVATLRKVVADEMRHAELGWRFCKWAIGVGGEPVRQAIEKAILKGIAVTRSLPIVDYGVDERAWRAHGRLTCREARAASERGISEIVEPCAAALLETAGREAKRPLFFKHPIS